MTTHSEQSHGTIRTGAINWSAGAVGGVIGTIVFITVQFVLSATSSMAMAIPAMYGIEGPAIGIGVALHLFHGAVLGVLYAGLVSVPQLWNYAATVGGGLALGIAYGVLTTIVFATVVMPVWLSAVGFSVAPSLPNFSILSLVFYLIYGVLLETAYPILSRRL